MLFVYVYVFVQPHCSARFIPPSRKRSRTGRGFVARVARDWPENAGWPSWAFENHDAPRAISRWCGGQHRDACVRAKMLLLCALRGSIIIYQGEELGLPQVDVPFERLQDPEAIANWPQTLSRDGARTPMPWNSAAPHLGFSTGEPWLPLGETHRALAIATHCCGLRRVTEQPHKGFSDGCRIQRIDQQPASQRACHERMRWLSTSRGMLKLPTPTP